jgi:hypothetical protein
LIGPQTTEFCTLTIVDVEPSPAAFPQPTASDASRVSAAGLRQPPCRAQTAQCVQCFARKVMVAIPARRVQRKLGLRKRAHRFADQRLLRRQHRRRTNIIFARRARAAAMPANTQPSTQRCAFAQLGRAANQPAMAAADNTNMGSPFGDHDLGRARTSDCSNSCRATLHELRE